jgi:formiminotetrahydrofolate cyclodeaminase
LQLQLVATVADHRPSTIDHRPSTIDHRPSTIDHRPSTIDHRPSTIDHRPSTFDLRPSTFDLRPSTFDLRPSTIDHRPSTIEYRPSTMKLIDRTVTDLLAAFRSSAPTPGGGSASALAGAMGASLLAMVAALPKPRAATAEEVERLSAAGDRCTALAEDLTRLVDRDSEAYDLVVAAYKAPKSTDDEKAARSAAIQEAMRAAIQAPLDVMRACAAAGEHASIVAALGNPSASSDVQVGLELLRAGLRGAKLNVEINLGSVKDMDYATAIREQVEGYERAMPGPG